MDYFKRVLFLGLLFVLCSSFVSADIIFPGIFNGDINVTMNYNISNVSPPVTKNDEFLKGLYDDVLKFLYNDGKYFGDDFSSVNPLNRILIKYHIVSGVVDGKRYEGILNLVLDFFSGLIDLTLNFFNLVLTLLNLLYRFIIHPLDFIFDTVIPWVKLTLWRLFMYSLGWTLLIECVIIGYAILTSGFISNHNFFNFMGKWFYGNIEFLSKFIVLIYLAFLTLYEVLNVGYKHIDILYKTCNRILGLVPGLK